jgi:cyclohexyl-isocyanide hydratase
MNLFAMLLVPNMTQLDFTGPYEVFARCPNARVELVWKSLEPVRTEHGLTITPTATFASLPQADVLFVPGGRGINDLLTDEGVLSFLSRQALFARYVTSVCTGSLVLGAAGLLPGRRAATHWTAMEMLPMLGAIPVGDRVVFDRRIATGAGVTAGIDFALSIADRMYGRETAEAIQLSMEYQPAPPFHAGHPDTAPAHVTAAYLQRIAVRQQERFAQVARAAARLAAPRRGSNSADVMS